MGRSNPERSDIAGLYRRFTRDGQGRSEPDLDALLALADGERSAHSERELVNVERSAMHADLLRFARALAPESARLAVSLEHAFEADRARHRIDRRASRRQAAPARRGWLRVVAGTAAALAVAIAVWSLQLRQAPVMPTAAQAPAAQDGTDRIFAAIEEAPHAATADVIFHGGFKNDRIFTSEFKGG